MTKENDNLVDSGEKDEPPMTFADESAKTKGGVFLSKNAKVLGFLMIGSAVIVIMIVLMNRMRTANLPPAEGDAVGDTYDTSDVFGRIPKGMIQKSEDEKSTEQYKTSLDKIREGNVTQPQKQPNLDEGWAILRDDPRLRRGDNTTPQTVQPEPNAQVSRPDRVDSANAQNNTINQAEAIRLDMLKRALEGNNKVNFSVADQTTADELEKRGNVSENDINQIRSIIGNNGNSQINQQLADLQNQGQQRQFGNDPNQQLEKLAFVNEDRGSRGYVGLPKEPKSPYELRAGTLIPAVLITKINSDLPGEILAHVKTDVRDSITGDHVLIPSGSKLVGRYDSEVVFGQKRVLVIWDRVNLPDGRILDLGTMQGVDRKGQSGLKDQVDNKFLEAFTAALLMSAFTAAVDFATQDDSDSDDEDGGKSINQSLTEALANNLGDLGAEMVRRFLDVQPTLTIRQGMKFNIFVSKDIIIPIKEKEGK